MFFKKNRQEGRDLTIAYKKVFGTSEGKTVLFDLMNRFHVLNAHTGDPLSEGQRAVVLRILHQVGVNMEELDRMIRGEQE